MCSVSWHLYRIVFNCIAPHNIVSVLMYLLIPGLHCTQSRYANLLFDTHLHSIPTMTSYITRKDNQVKANGFCIYEYKHYGFVVSAYMVRNITEPITYVSLINISDTRVGLSHTMRMTKNIDIFLNEGCLIN